jgi:hypothetical protein
MLRTGSLERAQENRRHLVLANGTGYWRSDLIASLPPGTTGSRSDGWSPQAFLVEQDADRVILSHYHEQDEFQVVVQGDGSFGRHAVGPVTVHYAGRHTGYGPIQAGPEGLWYFSLRAHSDPGARFLPEWRDRMERGGKRQLLAGPVSPGDPGTHPVIEPQSDGIAAWLLDAAPGEPLAPPELPAGAARYYLVVEGELRLDVERLPKFALAFTDESSFHPVAGPAGARCLALQFPC